MKAKFQADADLDARILRGLKRRAPEIDVQSSIDAGLKSMPDPQVLKLCADLGRILISQDRSTMPRHFQHFAQNNVSPGVILLRGGISIRAAIDEIILIWSATEAEEWLNRLVWIPL